MIQLRLRNHLQLKGLSPELRKLLIDELAFVNPQWLENDRMGRWNRGVPRVLKFYSAAGPDGLYVPRGYLGRFLRLCRERGEAFRIEDERGRLPEVDFGFRGALLPFQQAAVAKMLSKDFGTLCAPTGSGKTVMALAMIAARRQPAVIVVHTQDLAAQWLERIETFLGIPPAECGWIGGGRRRVGAKVSVALVQSLSKCAPEVSARTGFLVVDECHRCPSRTFTEAVTDFDSRYMLGLSATPWRRDQLSRLIFWHLGDIHHEVDRRALVASGNLLPAEVIRRETDFRPYHDPVGEYSRMLSELTADTARNLMIAADVAREAAESDGIVLVLSDRKAHCENLRALLRYRFKVDAALMTGDLTLAERQEVTGRLNSREIRVVIATGQLIGEGFDCPHLTTLFLATPIRFSGRLLQYLGRVLRPAPGKGKARVFDYVDIHVGPLVKAARSRERVYQL